MKIELSQRDRIVIKIGSSVLSSGTGELDKQRLGALTSEVSELKRRGYAVVIVSSGAIACGMQRLGYKNRPLATIYSSSAAAVGQALLMHNYEEFFQKDNFVTAQILLTSDGLHDRTRYLNARNTILNLLRSGDIIPIVNENDAVVTDEIKFGDNDKLSSQVAALIDAQLLIILSDVYGLYDAQGKVIEKIDEIDSCIRDLAGDTSKQTSVGGMITKLEAAKIATNAGISMVISNGHKANILEKIISGEEIGTWFLPKAGKISGKKRWIAFSCRDCGRIIVDDGAKHALLNKGSSLLAIGIMNVEKDFSFGDLVLVYDQQDNEIARGLTNYSRQELERIKGVKTSSIKDILGYKSYDEVIHRDNLVIIK